MLAAALILAQRPVDFPADFVGEWRGDMVWDRPGQDKPQTVAMSLAIRPNGTADDHEYRLKYGDQEPRPYVLRPKDRAKGHWQIDEGGGLVLDAFWVGGALVSAFDRHAALARGRSAGQRDGHASERRAGRSRRGQDQADPRCPARTAGRSRWPVNPARAQNIGAISHVSLTSILVRTSSNGNGWSS
jgi:hypothetical protein